MGGGGEKKPLVKRPSDANAAQSHQVDPTFVTLPSSSTLQRIWRHIFHPTPCFVFEETISFLQKYHICALVGGGFYIPGGKSDYWQLRKEMLILWFVCALAAGI